MTSIYGAIETISIRCRWLKTETVDCQKWKLFSSPLLLSLLCPPQPLRKCIKNIWTAFSPLGDLLNSVCKKALPRKWRLHSFYLLDLWQKAGEWRVGRRGADCLLHLSQWQGQFARDEKYDCKKKQQQQKKKPSRASVIVFLCHTLANANRRALQRAQLQRILPLLPSSFSSLFILFYAEWQTNP